MMKDGQFTTEEAMAALSLTVEEIEEMESQPKEPQPPMGKYGSLFWDYLKENHPGRHGFLLAETTLRDVCLEVDREAREMMETLTNQLHAKTPRPGRGPRGTATPFRGERTSDRAERTPPVGAAQQSAVREDDFMAAVRYETAIRDQAEEIVLTEIVYKPR
jgi:hypothetical protein